ncbi:U3 small nucleolar RNA-associated protein 10 [Exophiala dermatitidis]
MTSAFAAQLRTIAANSTNELDLRARRDAHGESLVFERSVAVKQDWETIYQICVEGFQELCMLDTRLREFEQNLYSPQAKEQDREQLSRSQNEALGIVIDRCLALLGSKVLLRPGIRAVEWLVRRFRVHVYNTSSLLATFLPYHESLVFRNVLSIIPANKITHEWKFLGPYHKNAANVPRHAIIYSAIHNDAFFSMLNNYVFRACQEEAHHPQLMRFWSSVVIEAITARLNQVKSGRKEVQRQRLEDALLKILPVLSEGLEITGCTELTITCFTVAIVLASNADLEDRVLDSIIAAIAPFVLNRAVDQATVLTCLCVLVSKKTERNVSRDVLEFLTKVRHLDVRLSELRTRVPIDGLCEAMFNSVLKGLNKSSLDTSFGLIEQLIGLSAEPVPLETAIRLVATLLRKVPKSAPAGPLESMVQERIVRILQKLNDKATFSSVLPQAASLAERPLGELEAIIQGTITLPDTSNLLESGPMEVDDNGTSADSDEERVDSMLAALPMESAQMSFMANNHTALFDHLLHAFAQCYRKEPWMVKFESMPIWRHTNEKPSDLLTSFLLRVAYSAAPDSQRSAALLHLSKKMEHGSWQETQLLLPYLAILLADPARPVRRAAVACVVAVQNCVSKSLAGESSAQSNSETVYDALAMTNVKRVSSAQAKKIVAQVYLPNLEECVLDPSHIRTVLEHALDSHSRTSSIGSKAVNVELKKSLRQDLFDLLTGCALNSPLLRVQLGLVSLLIGVQKVGSTTTSKTLQPILRHWASLTGSAATSAASSEGLDVAQIDTTLVQLISAHDKEAVQQVLETVEREKSNLRPELVNAIFARITAIWKDLRHESQLTAAKLLFDMSFSEHETIAAGSQQVLRSVIVSTEALATLLDHSCSGLAQMQVEVPPKKRRRISHGRESIPKEMVLQLDIADARLSLALELVEDSRPEDHPQLLGSLFEILIHLRRLKEKSTSESPYLLTLCLSNILAIIEKARQSRKPNVDLTSIRADLVTDCVRSSENPQVQSTALLLLASLSSIAPDRILHTIMPIFTFMGAGILSRDDERSVYVINQAIDQIIPPLISTLKRQDAKNLVHSTSSLLSSFVTAYDHIPQHRRVAFYKRLLDRLGADDFAFALVALLASRRSHEDMTPFLSVLTRDLPAVTQLLTHRKILALTRDIFSDKPHNAEPLLDINKSTKADRKEQISIILLETAAKLLESKGLKAQVKRLQKKDGAEAESFWTEYKLCLQDQLVMLKNQKGQQHTELTASTRKCLSALLALPSLAELFAVMPNLLQEMERVGDRELPPLALRVLAAQLQHNPAKDSKTQSEAMTFLPTVEEIIRTTQDDPLRHAAIACLDRIVEVYGRKSPDDIMSASMTLIEGDYGLSSQDTRTQIMSVLCVASMMEVLKEAAVPIVPQSMPKVLDLLRRSLSDNERNEELHNAVFTLLSSFLSYLAYMVSDDNVVEILELCYRSCVAEMDASCKESRTETLSLLAHKVDLSTVATSLSQAWKAVTPELGVNAEAVTEWLDVLSQAIEANKKVNVVRAAETISTFMFQVLDLRRLYVTTTTGSNLQITPEDIDAIESRLHTVSITFIYKLNDTAFRPLFESWVDWALTASDLAEKQEEYSEPAKTARETSLFKLATHFFESLKSIVTSYASYILEPANEVLKTMAATVDSSSSSSSSSSRSSKNKKEKPVTTITDEKLLLYKSTLLLLRTAMAHDADNWFSSPTHFSPLSSLLIDQLKLATTKNPRSLRSAVFDSVIPTIVALATATIDTPAHHHALNHGICQLRHNPSAGVRLAAIRTHLALTENPEVGEEWVANVVVGGTSTEGVGGPGETMVYVNESLEDDDEEVESEVRRWVRLVREMVGEDVFEV